MCTAVGFLYNNTWNFVHSNVVTTVDTMTAPLSDVFFPSVVVCNINQVKKEEEKTYIPQLMFFSWRLKILKYALGSSEVKITCPPPASLLLIGMLLSSPSTVYTLIPQERTIPFSYSPKNKESWHKSEHQSLSPPNFPSRPKAGDPREEKSLEVKLVYGGGGGGNKS